MCDERERLIGYVYDECDPAERAAIEAHLDGVPDVPRGDRRAAAGAAGSARVGRAGTRLGVAALRAAAPAPAWRDVPAWAMAAAAGVISHGRRRGGAATRAWFPAASAASATTATAGVPASTPVVTAEELAALEARVANRVRGGASPRRVPISRLRSPVMATSRSWQKKSRPSSARTLGWREQLARRHFKPAKRHCATQASVRVQRRQPDRPRWACGSRRQRNRQVAGDTNVQARILIFSVVAIVAVPICAGAQAPGAE